MSNSKSLSYFFLIVPILCSVLLFGSWLHSQEPFVRGPGKEGYQYSEEQTLWKTIDYAVFRTLNGNIEGNDAMIFLWGVTNHRSFDLPPLIWMISIFLIYYLRRPTSAERISLIQFGVYMTFCLIVVMVFSELTIDFYRYSPTISPGLEDEAFLLASVEDFMFDLSDVKDFSSKCFPGDHATVLTMIGFMLAWRLRGLYAVFALLGVILFTMPRMAGGAHWFSDIAAGGLAITLLFLPVFLFAPLYERALKLLEPWAGLCYKKLPRVLRASDSQQAQIKEVD